MRSVPCRIDEFGFLQGAPLHDGVITDLNYSHGDSADFLVSRDDLNSKTLLSCSGLVRFGSRLFLSEAIILSVLCWDLSNTPDFVSEAMDNPWRVLFGLDTREDILPIIARQRQTYPSHKLVSISCSYGGDFALICENVELFTT